MSNIKVCDRDLSEELLSQYLESDKVAVDTETMGLLPSRDRLCLVQLCDENGLVTAIKIEKGQSDAPNLKTLLEETSVLKIFHFARFDLATIMYHLDINVFPFFCTKIASKLARTYTGRHGLKELVSELEKVELDKSSQSSDWGNMDSLSEKQLDYAANDVRYLINIEQKLVKMLEREERLELAQSCFDCLPTIVTLDILQFKDIFEHH